jgi:hypothetical protein
MPRLVYRPKDSRSNELGMLDIALAGPKEGSPAPNVIRDEMDATRHMADGRYYTSKAKFRGATKDAGCIEVGNEIKTVTQPRKPAVMSREARREAIRTAIRQLQGN